MQKEKKQQKHSGKDFEQMVTKAIKGDKEALSDLCISITRDVLYMASCLLRGKEDAQ